jgi:hypothetical protein
VLFCLILSITLNDPFLNSLDELGYLRRSAGDVGFGSLAGLGKDGFEKILVHAALPAKDVGDNASRLTGVKCDADKKPGKAGGNCPHVLGE